MLSSKSKSQPSLKQVGVDPQPLAAQASHEMTGFEGLELVSAQMLMDLLEVPQRQRNSGSYLHSRSLDDELGLTAVRVREISAVAAGH